MTSIAYCVPRCLIAPSVSARKSRVECLRALADMSGTPSEASLNKRNYRQAKRQKEEARKMRQQQKEQRRSERAPAADASAITDVAAQEGEAANTMQLPDSDQC
jgi:hypothetical protein